MGGDTYRLLLLKVSLASCQLSVIGEMFFARKVLDIHTSPALGDSESLGGLWLSSHKLTYPRFPRLMLPLPLHLYCLWVSIPDSHHLYAEVQLPIDQNGSILGDFPKSKHFFIFLNALRETIA